MPQDNSRPDDHDLLASVRSRLSKAVSSVTEKEGKTKDSDDERLRRILEISEVMNTTRDIDKLFGYVIDRLIELFQAERGFLILIDETGEYKFKTARDLEGTNISAPEGEVSHTIIEKASQQRLPVLVENALEEDDFRGRASVQDLSLLSVMCAPLMARENLLGVVYVDNRSVPGQFTQRDLDLLRIFSNQAGVAIENAQLFKALRDAQDQLVMTEKLRAMGQMAAGVAHNFNNVLLDILGRTEIMLLRPLDPTFRGELEQIERSALDGASAVRRIQEFTRPRSKSTFQEVDIAQIVEQSLKVTETQWRGKAEAAGIQLAVEKQLTQGLKVRGVESELREVLICMILNALDAMPNGGTLRLASGLQDGRVFIEVSDTGCGMTEDVQKRVFDPFFTTKGLNGSGLGLSVAYGIISGHGGEIDVQSEVGKGTTFAILLPPAPTKEPLRVQEEPPKLKSTVAANVLVVDDDEKIQEVLKSMLSAGGHNAQTASSGEEALEHVGTTDFDLVLTDLAMPTMTGWEVAEKIKQIKPRTIVGIVTGFGAYPDEQKMRAHGVDLHIGKPMRLHELQNMVSQAMVLRSRPNAQ